MEYKLQDKSFGKEDDGLSARLVFIIFTLVNRDGSQLPTKKGESRQIYLK